MTGTPALLAHVGHDTVGLWTGLLHPVSGLDHVLAMVTVGVVALLLRRPVLVPATFVGSMVLGGVLGVVGVALPVGEQLIAISVVALGLALVVGASANVPAAGALVALAGIAHGNAHGLEAPTAAQPALYVVGFVVSTVLLHASGVAAGFALIDRPRWRATSGGAVTMIGGALLVGLL